MRSDQIEELAKIDEVTKQRQLDNQQTLTWEHADRAGRAAHGGWYTNPNITAAAGLSPVPVDAQAIHTSVQQQMANAHVLLEDPSRHIAGADSTVTKTYQPTLTDLLAMDPNIFNAPRHSPTPSWWEQVDPGAQWRNVEVDKSTVKTANDFISLDQAQAFKVIHQLGYQQIKDLPGWTKTIFDPKVKSRQITYDKYGNPNLTTIDNGTLDIAKAKFPELWQAVEQMDPTIMDNHFQPEKKREGWGKVTGYLKDVEHTAEVGAQFWNDQAVSLYNAVKGLPPAAVESMGVDSGHFNFLATGIRGLAKTATTILTGAAQATKGEAEYLLTHIGGPDNKSIGQDFGDWKNLVINGNVLTQAAENIVKTGNPQLGAGYFPAGKSLADAISAHDKGLPEVGGHVWTLGRASTEPLVQMGVLNRDGYAAHVVSGLIDATFTVATDPSMYFDPLKLGMEALSIDRVAATHVLEGRAAQKVLKYWEAARESAGLGKIINVSDELAPAYYDLGGAGEDFIHGAWQRVDSITPEFDKAAEELAAKTVDGIDLAGMDSPPVPKFEDSSIEGVKMAHGLIPQADGGYAMSPLDIDLLQATKSGRRTLQKLTEYDSVGQLYEKNLGRIPTGLAHEIQTYVEGERVLGKAPDLDKVFEILKKGALSGDPLYNLAERPGMIRQLVHDTGTQVSYWTSNKTRQLQAAPREFWFDWHDPESSLKNMKLIMTNMKVPAAKREEMLTAAIKTLVEKGPKGKFDLATKFQQEILRPALEAAGMDDNAIKEWTRWSKYDNSIKQTLMDRFGNSYPMDHLTKGTDVVREVDMMNNGFKMIDPESYNRLMRETAAWTKMIKPLRESETVGGIVNDFLDKYNVSAQWISNAQNKVLKPLSMGAPFPIALGVRMAITDALMTISAGETPLEFMQVVHAFGHGGWDTHGEVIKGAREITKIGIQMEERAKLGQYLIDAQLAGDTTKEVKLLSRIAKHEKEYGTVDEMRKMIDTYNERADMILPGMNRNAASRLRGLGQEEMKNPQMIRYRAANGAQTADRLENPEQWVIGTARDLARQSASPTYREVAKEIITNGPDKALENLTKRFHSGDLRDMFVNNHLRGVANQDPTYVWDSVTGINKWLKDIIIPDIMTRTNGDTNLLNVVASGMIDGTRAEIKVAERLYEAHPYLKKYVRETLLEDPTAPNKVLFHPDFVTKKTMESSGNMLMTGMSKTLNVVSSKLMREPLGQYWKWTAVSELIPAMKPSEAKAMLATVEKLSDFPKSLIETIRELVPEARGTASRKEIELLGTLASQRKISDLFYEAGQKSFFGRRHNLMYAFMDPYIQHWMKWGRAIAMKPTILEQGRVLQQGMQNIEVPSWAGGQPSKGFEFNDPSVGRVFGFPISNLPTEQLGLHTRELIPTKNLSLAPMAAPGAFGIGAYGLDMALSQFGKNNPYTNSLRHIFFPRGTTTIPQSLPDYFIPAWGQAVLTGAAGVAVKAGMNPDIFDKMTNLFSGQQNGRNQAQIAQKVMTANAANWGELDTPEKRSAFIQDSQSKAVWVGLLQGVFKWLVPGSPYTQYYTKIGDTIVSQGEAISDLRATTNNALSNGKTYDEGVQEWLQKVGPDGWIYLTGASKTTPGMQPTKEWYSWWQQNSHVMDKYPNAGGFLGPQFGVFSPDANRELIASQDRKYKTLNERLWDSQASLAKSIINNAIENYVKQGETIGLTRDKVFNNDSFIQNMKIIKDQVRTKYPAYDPKLYSAEMEALRTKQFDEIALMAKDKNVLNADSGKGLATYWDFRTNMVSAWKSAYPSQTYDTWKTSTASANFRQALYDKGIEQVKLHPEFSSIWEKVLSREFDPPIP
jgi:hypothetical protein